MIELKNVLDSDFELPDAEVYFIYDFSEQDDIYQILKKLILKTQNKLFYLITKGDRVDYLVENKFKHIWRLYKNLGSSEINIYTSKSV